MQRPAKCPACGSDRIAEILFPSPAIDKKLQDALKAGRAVPAGRASTGNDPRWRCLKCRFEWGHPRGLSGSSAGERDLA
jgi:hypothetical protein